MRLGRGELAALAHVAGLHVIHVYSCVDRMLKCQAKKVMNGFLENIRVIDLIGEYFWGCPSHHQSSRFEVCEVL